MVIGNFPRPVLKPSPPMKRVEHRPIIHVDDLTSMTLFTCTSKPSRLKIVTSNNVNRQHGRPSPPYDYEAFFLLSSDPPYTKTTTDHGWNVDKTQRRKVQCHC